MAHHTACSPAERPGRRVGLPLPCLLITLFLIVTCAKPAPAEEPLLVIAKNTLLGSMTGVVLAGTLTLVVDDDSRMDVVRWGVVIGTFSGFGMGVWIATHPSDDLFGMANSAADHHPSSAGRRQWSRAMARHALTEDPTPPPIPHACTPQGTLRLTLLRLN